MAHKIYKIKHMAQQTAVDWLIEQIEQVRLTHGHTPLHKLYQLKKEANAINKKQMHNVAEDWLNEGASYMYDGKRKYQTFEQYYNEKYGE
jgi:predicted hydrocarbon binding protein